MTDDANDEDGGEMQLDLSRALMMQLGVSNSKASAPPPPSPPSSLLAVSLSDGSNGAISGSGLLIGAGPGGGTIALRQRRSGWKDWFATRLTETAVSSAILLKQSPIPDALGVATDASLNGYRRLDEELNIHERLVQAVHTSVNNAIQYGLIFANAALKAGVAYQQTPGYRFTKHRQILTPEGNELLIVRVGGMPGAFPIYPELIERSTQTDVSLPCMSSLDDDDMSQATANTTAVAQLLTLPSTASQGSSLSASDTSLNQRRLLSTKLSASGLSDYISNTAYSATSYVLSFVARPSSALPTPISIPTTPYSSSTTTTIGDGIALPSSVVSASSSPSTSPTKRLLRKKPSVILRKKTNIEFRQKSEESTVSKTPSFPATTTTPPADTTTTTATTSVKTIPRMASLDYLLSTISPYSSLTNLASFNKSTSSTSSSMSTTASTPPPPPPLSSSASSSPKSKISESPPKFRVVNYSSNDDLPAASDDEDDVEGDRMLNTSSFGGGAGHTTFGSSSSNDFNKSALELLSTTAVPTFEVPESSYLSLFRKIMFGSSASSPLTEASSISSPLPSPPTPSSSSSSSSSKLDSVDVLIHLNVGGRYFPTMLSTLTAVAGSRFDEMFGGIKAHIFAQINPAPSSAAATTSSVLFASHGDEDIITKKSKSSLAADASRGGHGGEEVDNGILEERSFMSTTSTMYSNNNTPNIYNNNTVIIPNDDLRLPISADGCFFLDRDGTLFHYILHYLRHISVTNTPPQQQATTASHYHTPTPILSLSNIFITPSTLEKIQTGIIPLPPTQPELWALIRECKYFGLLELETICRQRLTEVRTREYAGSVYKAMMGPILEMVRLVLVNGVWILTMMETFLEVQGYTGYVKKRFAGPDVTDSSSVEVLTTTTSRFSNWGVLEYCLLRMMILVAIGTVFAFLYIYLL